MENQFGVPQVKPRYTLLSPRTGLLTYQGIGSKLALYLPSVQVIMRPGLFFIYTNTLSDMTIDRKDKNNNIAVSIRKTREKRKGQVCVVYIIKIDFSKLNKKQKEQLKMLFVEAKWYGTYRTPRSE